jgi:hypothetical protein
LRQREGLLGRKRHHTRSPLLVVGNSLSATDRGASRSAGVWPAPPTPSRIVPRAGPPTQWAVVRRGTDWLTTASRSPLGRRLVDCIRKAHGQAGRGSRSATLRCPGRPRQQGLLRLRGRWTACGGSRSWRVEVAQTAQRWRRSAAEWSHWPVSACLTVLPCDDGKEYRRRAVTTSTSTASCSSALNRHNGRRSRSANVVGRSGGSGDDRLRPCREADR